MYITYYIILSTKNDIVVYYYAKLKYIYIGTKHFLFFKNNILF